MRVHRLLPLVVVVGCGTVRTPFNSGDDEHAGLIHCHGVLLPAKAAPRPVFLCSGGITGCEASRREQLARNYAVSDCTPHPHAACMPTDSGQICLATLAECRELARSAVRDPSRCVVHESEVGVHPGALSGVFETRPGDGDATALRHGPSVDIRYATGAMRCTLGAPPDETTATCAWTEGDKNGRVRLVQQSDGSWATERADDGLARTFRRKR